MVVILAKLQTRDPVVREPCLVVQSHPRPTFMHVASSLVKKYSLGTFTVETGV